MRIHFIFLEEEKSVWFQILELLDIILKLLNLILKCYL